MRNRTMDYEEKYKSALKWIKAIYPELSHTEQMEAEIFFPELREPDDKKIKKCIIDTLKGYHHLISTGGITKKDMIAWIEKQGEKNLFWSEKDEEMLNKIIEELTPCGECPDYPSQEDRDYYYGRSAMIDWLKKQFKQRPEVDTLNAFKNAMPRATKGDTNYDT